MGGEFQVNPQRWNSGSVVGILKVRQNIKSICIFKRQRQHALSPPTLISLILIFANSFSKACPGFKASCFIDLAGAHGRFFYKLLSLFLCKNPLSFSSHTHTHIHINIYNMCVKLASLTRTSISATISPLFFLFFNGSRFF